MRRTARILAAGLLALAACGGGDGGGGSDPGGVDVAAPDLGAKDLGAPGDDGLRDAVDPGAGPDEGDDPGIPPADESPADPGTSPADPGVPLTDEASADPGVPPTDETPADPGMPPTDEAPADPGTVDPGSPDAGPVDPGIDVPPACPRPLGPADRERILAISHPFQAAGGKSTDWEVLRLATDGTLSVPGVHFAMGTLSSGTVAFTPDGAVALAAQEDGSVGVVRFDDGVPVVVHAGFKGSFYAAGVVMDPSGQRAFVLNNQWRENGGGVYAVAIGCDGELTDLGLVAAAKMPARMELLPSGRAVVAANDLLESTQGNVHLLDFGPPAAWIDGVPAFPDSEAIVSSSAASPDGRFVLFGDNSEYSGIPNRVAVVEVVAGGLAPVQVLAPVPDPVGLAVSPYNNAAIAVDGYGNAVRRLSFDPSAAAPFQVVGPVTYVGKKPQLPSGVVVLDRGGLKGLILVAELSGVRRMRFEADGTVTDLGLTNLGDGVGNIVGGLGVQP